MFGAPVLFFTSSLFTQIDAETGSPRSIGHGRVHLRRRKRDNATGPLMTRICGSSSIGCSGFGCLRVSEVMCCAALARPELFHS